MPAGLSQRARLFRHSVIVEVAREAHRVGAVDLAMGAPDFPPLDDFRKLAAAALERDVHQYGNGWGNPRLRAAIARKTARHLGVEVDPETEITVTVGATEGIFLAMLVTLDPGDEILLFEPVYENYISAAVLVGAVPRYVRTRPPGWRFDPEEIAAAFTPRTRMIILNSPSNPTGKAFSEEELRLLAGLCRKWDVLCLTDEIYEHLVFDGVRHRSMLQLPEMRDRTIAVSALSKTCLLTGWRIGWVIAPAAVTAAIRHAHEAVTVSPATPLQDASIPLLELPDDYYRRLAAGNQARHDRLASILGSLGFECLPTQGGFFLMADIGKLTGLEDLAFVRFLIAEIGVAAVPGSAFFVDPADGRRLLRFCFSKSDETLAAAELRLRALPEKLSQTLRAAAAR